MKKLISIFLLLALFSAFACAAGAETVAISGDKIDIGTMDEDELKDLAEDIMEEIEDNDDLMELVDELYWYF